MQDEDVPLTGDTPEQVPIPQSEPRNGSVPRTLDSDDDPRLFENLNQMIDTAFSNKKWDFIYHFQNYTAS